MDPVVHFEMAYEDRERMSDFYTKAFGWKAIHLPDMGDYVMVQTGETDEQGMVQKPGMINGGFYKKPDGKTQAPSVVIAVENLEESLTKVTENGGVILDQPMDIPGIGRYFSLEDTEGNRVGVLQPLPMN